MTQEEIIVAIVTSLIASIMFWVVFNVLQRRIADKITTYGYEDDAYFCFAKS